MTRLFAGLLAALSLAWAAPALATEIILTSGTTWTVPADWNDLANTIEVIGAGADAAPHAGGGGGGGAYAKLTNVSLTPGAVVSIQIGTPSTTKSVNRTWFSSPATLSAAGAIGATGGLVVDSVGDAIYPGGGSGFGGDGGGGAAGRNGAGANSSGTTGGQGDNGTGGAGGTGGAVTNDGAAGTEMGSIGAGGGGGGDGGGAAVGGNGGLYGGGGGDGDGLGAQGVILITYQPYRRTSGGAF